MLQQCSRWLEILWSSSLCSSQFLIPHVALLSLIMKNKQCFCSQSGNRHKQLEITGLHRGREQGVRKDLGRASGKLLCEEFPVALHLCWRSSKREFIWASAEWSVQSWAEFRTTSVCYLKLLLVLWGQVCLNSFGVMQSRLAKKGAYATGKILLVSPPLWTCSVSLENQSWGWEHFLWSHSPQLAISDWSLKCETRKSSPFKWSHFS